MKRISLVLLLIHICLYSYSQSSYEIVSELENLYRTYNITGLSYGWSLKKVNISFSAPMISIHTISERNSSGWTYVRDVLYKFDVTKAWYDNRTFGGNKSLVISGNLGVDEELTSTDYPPSSMPFGRPTSNFSKKLHDYYGIPIDSDVIINRLINAFKNLKALSNEANVKSTPHIFDDAELVVQKISFVAPDETGKLKANQTGCIKVEVKNSNSNNALEVSCIVKEKNKSDMFSYEQYTSLDKIPGFDTGIINIPIKASENIDNSSYQFDIRVTYKGKTLKEQTINIVASNPKKPVASTNVGGSRNKTVRMRKMAGNTYLISCKVNGLPLDFIFDTGASSVTLSRKQAVFMLKNGYLSKSDIIGSNAYQTASGDIAIGTVIKLKKIEINGLVLNNVEASIINSDSAPLLLGQSALSRLGKIQIDYKNSTLTIIR